MDVTILDRLLQIGELFQHDMARAFAGTGLTSARVRVLWVLQHGGPMTQQALAGALEVSPRNVTGLVDALEASGHVRRTPHPNDRRAVLVELSKTAEQTMAQMQRDHAELSATLLDAVEPGERAAVERGVAAIADRLAMLVAEAREAGS
ncbi:MarR family transcriptional regulator [Agromyces mediolanus]|uniref:MarR family winged helix-turn-helix transcriptional regulator n=1 Tax=Agromyces mediolanus TaxID=41986 RepID=UPI00203B31C4|nr:MarR family transcriptional regulator [Agromyces mediolanus]MCM3658536.1 MarR family transcriptional regulator [Agromyces mediolanus]